jgi:hypothetical protein
MSTQEPPGAKELTELLESFKSLTPDEQKVQREDLRFLLQRRIEGIHYAETRRNGIATLATGVFAAGIALIATTTNVRQISPSVGVALMILSVGFVVSGVLTWIVFVRQINPNYPFLSATSNIKWFYHGALPAKSVLAPFKKLSGTFTSKSEEAQRVAEFNKMVPHFYSTVKSWIVDPNVSLEADIKQLHSLHSNECIKNAQLTLIRSVFVWTVGISLLVSLFVLIISGMFIRSSDVLLKRTPVVRQSTVTGTSVQKYVLELSQSNPGSFKVRTAQDEPVEYTIDGYLTTNEPLQLWVPTKIAAENETLQIKF